MMAYSFRYSLFIAIFFLVSCSRSEKVGTDDLGHDLYFNAAGIKLRNNEIIRYNRHYDNASIHYTIKRGRLNGECIGHYKNGNIEIKGFYKEGQMHGEWMKWYENGNCEFQINYKNGFLEGPYTTWHANGQLKEKGAYKKNEPIGKWEVYNNNGKLIKTFEYDSVITSAL